MTTDLPKILAEIHNAQDALNLLKTRCPWPESVWPMTDAEYVAAIPNPHARTCISGYLMRKGWEIAIQDFEKLLCTAPEKAGQTNATPAAETLNPAASGGEGWPRYFTAPSGSVWKAENQADPGAWWNADLRRWDRDSGHALIEHVCTNPGWLIIKPTEAAKLGAKI